MKKQSDEGATQCVMLKLLKEFMMDHLRINFERLRNEELKSVLDAVERVFTGIGIYNPGR